jgi:hypothetical protein
MPRFMIDKNRQHTMAARRGDIGLPRILGLTETWSHRDLVSLRDTAAPGAGPARSSAAQTARRAAE